MFKLNVPREAIFKIKAMKKETYNRILTLYMTGLEEQLDNELCRLNETELAHLAELTAGEHPQLAKIANYLLTEV